MGTHFTPSYNPWDQRLCLVPDADLFEAIKAGRARVVTDHIESFTETGIRLKSGAELAADIIVTATGLTLQVLNAPGAQRRRPHRRCQPDARLQGHDVDEGVPNPRLVLLPH